MAGCGIQCMKYLLFIFNFIIWLGGGATLAFGLILYFGLQSWIPIEEVATLLDVDDFLSDSSFVIIGVGSFTFLVGFCGCCGAITESKILLIPYILFIFLLFCGQITSGILASISSTHIEEFIDDNMIDGFRKAYGDGETADKLTKAWRLAESALDCCGYHGGSDYSKNDEGNYYSLYKNANKYPDFPDFPESCCFGASYPEYNADNPSGCRSSWSDVITRDKDTATYHGQGCKTRVANVVDEYINFIRAGGIGLAIVMLVSMVFAIFVCCSNSD